MLIVDAHLDLAYNASRGRQVLRAASQQTADAQGIPSVGLPDLRDGGVGLICGTMFVEPHSARGEGYKTAEEAYSAAWPQLQWYRQQEQRGEISIVRSRSDLPAEGAVAAARISTILLLEGADAIRHPEEVPVWFEAGLRLVGLAWKRTRAAGGTGEPGPLTGEGRAVVRSLDAAGILHDVSHLAEDAFWQLLDVSAGPVMASHSNCRAIVPTDRQLSDAMIRAIAGRGGVIGINLYDRFLPPPAEFGKRPVTLADVVRHVRHICELVGDARHVGIGSDMDGGFGRENLPAEIATSADLPRVGEALARAGFSDDQVRGIMGLNWLQFFRRTLPVG